MLERLFKLREQGTNVKTEAISGTTTFMTMSYIIFVQPAVLAAAGMDHGAVMVATCVASAVATLLMGLVANYPIALAPAMGHNFYFAFTVCGAVAAGGLGYGWDVALGAVFISGTIFIILSLLGLWEGLVAAVPDSLKHSIAVGIGLLIALVGFEWGGIVVAKPGTYIGLGDLASAPVLITLGSVLFIGVLTALRIRGAILWGILAAALVGLPLGITTYQGLVELPPSVSPTLFKLDIMGALRTGLVEVVFVFFFLDFFDTVGTLIGVSDQAGFLVKGRLPRASKAMLSDAIGTVAGAFLGTSTVTSYVESATGVAEGGRTGLSNIFTGLLFLAALFFYPLAQMVGGGYEAEPGVVLRPAVAPALIIVGLYMMKGVARIAWDDFTEALPAFITITIMTFSISITEGIAFGFITYSVVKVVSGRGREAHWVLYLFSALFILRYFYIR